MATKSKTAPINLDPTAASHEAMHGANDVGNSHLADLLEGARSLGIVIPDWKRTVLTFIASFCAGWAIGTIASVVLEVLFMSAVTLTGSLFVAWAIYILGFIIAMYAAIKSGQAIGMYIATGNIDRDVSRAWKWTTGLFSGKDKAAKYVLAADGSFVKI